MAKKDSTKAALLLEGAKELFTLIISSGVGMFVVKTTAGLFLCTTAVSLGDAIMLANTSGCTAIAQPALNALVWMTQHQPEVLVGTTGVVHLTIVSLRLRLDKYRRAAALTVTVSK